MSGADKAVDAVQDVALGVPAPPGPGGQADGDACGGGVVHGPLVGARIVGPGVPRQPVRARPAVKAGKTHARIEPVVPGPAA